MSELVGLLMKVAISLGKNVLAPLGITAAQKKIHGSGTTTLIISNKEMNDNENRSGFGRF